MDLSRIKLFIDVIGAIGSMMMLIFISFHGPWWLNIIGGISIIIQYINIISNYKSGDYG